MLTKNIAENDKPREFESFNTIARGFHWKFHKKYAYLMNFSSSQLQS